MTTSTNTLASPLLRRRRAWGRGLALALTLGSTIAMAQEPAAPKVRPLLAAGIVGGGDKLSTIDVQIGRATTTQNVRAGGRTEFRFGAEFAFHPQWSLQASAGYVTDGVRAENGKVTFTAWPVEALAHYRIVDAWRVGAGLRAPLKAAYEEGGVGGNVNTGFTAKVTPVVEVEWLVTRSIGIKLRGMKETYKVKGSSAKVDGSSAGLMGTYYFF